MKYYRYKKVRIIFKVTNIFTNEYYIGKGMIKYIPKEYVTINHLGNKYTKKWFEVLFKTSADNLKFELLEYDIPHIFMEEVLDKYLKDETNPRNLIYSEQRSYFIKKIQNNS